MEKKYDIFEKYSNKNTFTQFDDWEPSSVPAQNNRYLYDFSDQGMYRFKTQQGYAEGYQLRNLARQEDVNHQYNRISTSTFWWKTSPWPGGTPGAPRYPGGGGLLGNSEYIDDFFSGQILSENKETKVFTIDQDLLVLLDGGGGPGGLDFSQFIETFRSGYIEFTFKSNKNNMVIMSGSTEVDLADFGFMGVALQSTSGKLFLKNKGDLEQQPSFTPGVSDFPTALNDNNYYTSTEDKGFVNLSVELLDGKLCLIYKDLYNQKNIAFDLLGNKVLSDNNWHHVVINFGRPGLIKYQGSKLNKKNIEFWVDGKLDKRFSDTVIESEQIFYPVMDSLYSNLRDMFYNYENSVYPDERDSKMSTGVTFNVFTDVNWYKNQQNIITMMLANKKDNFFRGAMHTFAHGISQPLNIKDIQKRYALWSNKKIVNSGLFNAKSKIVEPVITTDSKKALKLFWNTLVDLGKDGVSLDNNYQVESVSVTHQTTNSKSEIFNQNMSPKKTLNKLNNVRVVLTEDVMHFAPGAVKFNNTFLARLAQALPPFGTETEHPKNLSSKNVAYMPTSEAFREINHREIAIGELINTTFSNVNLQDGDRILLTNQIMEEQNGIWIFNGKMKTLTRDQEDTIKKINDGVVFVEEGDYENTHWAQVNKVKRYSGWEKWVMFDSDPEEAVRSRPIYGSRWSDEFGIERFIDLENDIDISRYDLIVFMNYPETMSDVYEAFPEDIPLVIENKYKKFIKSLQNVVAQGSSLFVSSPLLASDLKIIKNATTVDQEEEDFDNQSSIINPFQFGQPAERYFDTHRQNYYKLVTEVSGLTDKETYLLTDFINFIPEDDYELEHWHAKYEYRQFGIKEGNEFIIPSLPLLKKQTRTDLPGQRNNSKIKSLNAVEPQNIITGTVVTQLATNTYRENGIQSNDISGYATTIIVHNNQVLDGQPVSGKIFVNFAEDGYAMSLEKYNKAIIQNVPSDDPNENFATLLWLYSTSRTERNAKTSNLGELTKFGQTVPKNSSGGALIQSPTHSSLGEIRSDEEIGNPTFESDLYGDIVKEKYSTTEIPTLSMTMLGLKWLEA